MVLVAWPLSCSDPPCSLLLFLLDEVHLLLHLGDEHGNEHVDELGGVA